MTETIIVSNLACAVIGAKWALDLGFTQIRQMIFLVGGLLFGPLVLLVLYVLLVNKAKDDGVRAGKAF